MSASPVWKEVRDMSHEFSSGIVELFFGADEKLRELTTEYGVF